MTRTSRTSKTALALLLGLSAGACAHSVRLITVPEGAAVSLNGKPLGKGPILFEERSGVLGRSFTLSAELAGYPKLTKRESVKICPTPANLILDSLGIGFLWGFCLRDEYVLDLTAAPR